MRGRRFVQVDSDVAAAMRGRTPCEDNAYRVKYTTGLQYVGRKERKKKSKNRSNDQTGDAVASHLFPSMRILRFFFCLVLPFSVSTAYVRHFYSYKSFLERKKDLRKVTCHKLTANRITIEKMENH